MQNAAVVVEDIRPEGMLLGASTSATRAVRAELADPWPLSGGPLLQCPVHSGLVRWPDDEQTPRVGLRQRRDEGTARETPDRLGVHAYDDACEVRPGDAVPMNVFDLALAEDAHRRG